MSAMAQAWGGPGGCGRLRSEPEDFRVEEILGFAPDGAGEHVLLWIEKRGANTGDVVEALARFAGVRASAIGTSGRKDRHAVTGQWFSVHLPGREEPDWSDFSGEHWWVQRAERHGRKLRTGTHRANRFRLRVRDFSGDRDAVEVRLARIATDGFPNYFGPQRFGQAGENLRRARALFAGSIRPRRSLRSIYLSAARSWLFNRVLAARVADGSWLQALPDDALMLAGRRSMFRCTGEETDLASRIVAGDLHVTGPLWGRGTRVAGTAAHAREREWVAGDVDLVAGLEAVGMEADRRALRASAAGLDWGFDDDTLELAFELESGVFATALLFEVVDTATVA